MAASGGKVKSSEINRALDGGPLTPVVVLRRATMPQAVANGGAAFTWDVEDEDTHGWHNSGVNPARITPGKAGVIEFTSTVHWTANATGRRGVGIRKNGGTINYGMIIPASSVGTTSVTVTVRLRADGVADYFEAFFFQDSGGALNALDANSTRFEAEWIRD
jgi:hypothetical protein